MRLAATKPGEEQWLVIRTSAGLTHQARGIKAIDGKGHIRGMVVYDNWTPNSVQAHVAVDAAIVWRSLIPEVFRYPFWSCGKSILIGLIPAGNEKSCIMVTHLGFKLAHRVTDGWQEGEDLHVYEMRASECRWLKSQAHIPLRAGFFGHG